MVKQIHIENYKSVQSLDIELGRLNVFIGANGCGKTNILEAIALGSAAAADKLDHEFLGTRGIRVTEPKAMKSGFDWKNTYTSILISFIDKKGDDISFSIYETNDIPANWVANTFGKNFNLKLNKTLKQIMPLLSTTLENASSEITLIEKTRKISIKANSPDLDIQEKISNLLVPNIIEEYIADWGLSQFLIFSPENYFLRRFEEESQIKPLGIRGEGLFSHLVDLIQIPETFNKIKEQLQLIDWFDDFEIPNDLYFNQRKITIKDRFIAEGLQYFDQRSANEGFLYLLFYVTLFISPYTPKFFAIDNIDNSLNPKLCSELTKMLAQLAKDKDHEKQAILTTHNPAVLDGLNLNDEEQRLFVIYRNADGHTKAERIFKKEMPEGVKPVKLSEQFLRGYLGGLNRNF